MTGREISIGSFIALAAILVGCGGDRDRPREPSLAPLERPRGGRRTRVVRRPGRSERSRFRARQRGERPVLPARDQRVWRRTVRLRQRRRPRHLAGAGRQRRSSARRRAAGGRLYRNDLEVRPDGTRTLRFTDVTAASGIVTRGYGMGVAAGDIDNDGWIDLYVTGFGRNQMFRNNGDGTFADVSLASRHRQPRDLGRLGSVCRFRP